VPENETILYRGASFELGHGSGFYGIWPSGSPRPPSIEWWPDTPDGWQGAWARYNALEVPGSITMVSPQQQQQRQAAGHLGTRALLAAGLLAAGIICGLAGLFPSYLAGSSLTSQASQVIPHVFYLAGWIASLVLILLGGARLRVGVLLSLGLSVVTFGFFFSDAGEVIADGSHIMGAGLALSLIGWLACAAGSVVALPLGAGSFRRSVTQLRSTFAPAPAAPAPQAPPAPATQFPPAAEVQPAEAAPSPSDAPEAPEVPSAAAPEAEPGSEAETESEAETAAPGSVAATPEVPPHGGLWTSPVPATPPYAPNTAYGAYQPARSSRWSNPVARRAILTVSVAVLAAIGAAITFAPSWDSYTLRTAGGTVHTLTAGNAFSNPAAVIVGDVAVMVALVLVAAIAALWRPAQPRAALVAQAISALAQLGEAASPAQFGISSAEASQLGLTISQGVTAVFWIYCVFVVALAVICGWLFAKPRRTRQAVAPAAVGTYT
jgi:MFS family permease